MNTSKNPLPFYPLQGTVWTNTKTLWQSNSAYCNNYKYQNKYYPGVHYFQVKILNSESPTSIAIRKVSDDSVVAGLTINTNLFADNDGQIHVIIDVDLLSALIGDSYYVALQTNGQYYYSEIFCVANNQNDRIQIIYASSCRVGDLIYPNNFKNVINLDARLIPGEPSVEEETIEDGFGNEKPTYQKLTQSYTFSVLVPNYLAEALSALKLHNQFNVIDFFNNESGSDFDETIIAVEVQTTGEEDNCFSIAQVTFTKETIVKTACCDDEFQVVDTYNSTVYNENLGIAGGEWDGLTFGVVPVAVDLDATDDPSDGTKHIKFSDIGVQAFFTANVLVTVIDKTIRLQFKQPAVQSYDILVTVTDTLNAQSETFNIEGTNFGLNPASTAYQQVDIDISGIDQEYFNRISFTCIDLDTELYIDDVEILTS